MKTLLLSAAAVVVLATSALPAAAASLPAPDDGPAGWIVEAGNNDNYRYDHDPYGNDWPYDDSEDTNDRRSRHYDPYGGQGGGWGQHNDWNNGWNNGWNQGGYYGDVLPPRVIVKKLYRRDFRYVSQPVLSGRWYQVKAIAPNGRKVKLYIDPYSGRIVKAKYRG